MNSNRAFRVKFVQNYYAMKKLMIVSFSFAALLSSCGDFVGVGKQAESIEIPSSEKKIKTEVLAENKVEVKMEVEGMTCAMGCAKSIEDKVGDLDGVVASSVNFEDKIATFEFDKTTTSPEKIQEFIGNIHDGQYSAKPVENEDANSEEKLDTDENTNKEKSVTSVSERINISFPELFTYFIKRIR